MARIVIILVFLCGVCLSHAKERQVVSIQRVAERVLCKGMQKSNIKGYEGSLLLQGMSELVLATSSDSLLRCAINIMEQFGTKEIKGGGSFISYEAGGSGAALLDYRGVTSLLRTQVAEAARKMVEKQNRSSEGLLIPSWVSKEKDQVFIDMAFAVTPYLLYTGLSENNQTYIDLAVFETLELFRILADKQSGLIHQGRGFVAKDIVSQDNWSRGNGWGALALGVLVVDLPQTHPQRKEVERLTRDFYLSVLKYQDENGMWHQEMTDKTSYAETSGTGLLLYGMGMAIQAKVLDKKYIRQFIKGLQGLAAYIEKDGSVSNACWSCLCPKNGTKEDYKNHPSYYNDSHAFGPVVLAFAQALKMGIKEMPLEKELGYAITQKPPMTYVRFVPERKGDIAWENDRIAFRVYARTVKSKVGSGVDVWAKSVAHSVIDNWYSLNAKGQDYHVDRGEGYDFYNLGFSRGCGGTSVYYDGKLFSSEPYANYRIYRNDEDGIEFEMSYHPYLANGLIVYEKKRIRMINGTNFYQVTSTFETENGEDIVVAVGITNFGKANVSSNKHVGCLSMIEEMSVKDGILATAVFANPSQILDFGTVAKDELVLLNVKSKQPFTYYVGAGWSGDVRFSPFIKWNEMLNGQSWERLNCFYSENN